MNPIISTMPFQALSSLPQLEQLIAQQDALLVWFTSPDCTVCDNLKPRVAELFEQSFPRISLYSVNCDAVAEVRGQFQVFAVPTMVLFLQGRESLRKSRQFSLAQLAGEVDRPYRLLFE